MAGECFQYLCMFAGALAGLISHVLNARMGRKWCMVIAGFFFTIGAAINAGAQDLAMLYVGRVLLGFGVGFANQSVSHPAYVHLVSQNFFVSEPPFVITPSGFCTNQHM